MESVYLISVCQSVCLPFTNHCIYQRGGRHRECSQLWCEAAEGRYRRMPGWKGQETSQIAWVLRVGDTGATWHYTLTARWEREEKLGGRDDLSHIRMRCCQCKKDDVPNLWEEEGDCETSYEGVHICDWWPRSHACLSRKQYFRGMSRCSMHSKVASLGVFNFL